MSRRLPLRTIATATADLRASTAQQSGIRNGGTRIFTAGPSKIPALMAAGAPPEDGSLDHPVSS